MFYDWSDLQKLGYSNHKSRAASIFRKIDFELYMVPWTRSVEDTEVLCIDINMKLELAYHWALCSDIEVIAFRLPMCVRLAITTVGDDVASPLGVPNSDCFKTAIGVRWATTTSQTCSRLKPVPADHAK